MGAAGERPLIIEPAPARWTVMAGPFPGLTEEQRRFREQLGLPLDRPLVMTGHQAQVWHPGILAKYLAADAARRAWGAESVWLVVDQDDNEPGLLRYPIRTTGGRLKSIEWNAGGRSGPKVASGLRPAFEPAPPPPLPDGATLATDSVGQGLERIHRALASGAREPSAAAQLGKALSVLMEPLGLAGRTILASAIGSTEFFDRVWRLMREDPKACIIAYNRAAARHPGARVRALGMADGRRELPLWRLDGARRVPVFAEDREAGPLVPRGLLMTGLLRAGACDLFIHGTGGAGLDARAGYEAVTDDWFRDWRGQAPAAPVAVVTATLRLPIPGQSGAAARADAVDAAGLAHRARHDPVLLGEAAAAERKRELVRLIDREKRPGGRPAPLYRQMHELLESVRKDHAPELARLDARAAVEAASRSDLGVAMDRTWPFPFYPEPMLRDLKVLIDHEFRL